MGKRNRVRQPNDALKGKSIAFFGEFASWPKYHSRSPSGVAAQAGARITTSVDESLDILVIGEKRAKGRADAIRKAERINTSGVREVTVLDESAYRDLVRYDVTGKTFFFCGRFDCCPNGFDAKLLGQMIESVGGVLADQLNEKLDFLVVGNRRGKGKTAAQRVGTALQNDGATLEILDEDGFLELVRNEVPTKSDELSFPGFMGNLYGVIDKKKIQRAMKMLQSSSFQLYSILDDQHLVGIVRSQTRDDTTYVPYVDASGRYGCVTTDLDECMGLQGSPCKHLMVLVMGLVRSGEFDAGQAWSWIRKIGKQKPKADPEFTTEILLQYKGVEAGEVDWRPTETTPEDYYML
ncbi:MAG: hypothetical protein AAF802_10695 [Planctomycetota bacterium]